MKIIQSYIKIDDTLNHQEIFYSYLFSYILLKKLYGNVSCICNKLAYNSFLKYIPYDEFLFIEPPNIPNIKKFWSISKINAYKNIEPPFIHIDGDVMMFEDHLSNLYSSKYDIIYQSTELFNGLFVNEKYHKIHCILNKNKLLLDKKFNHSANTGVIGFFDNKIKNQYIEKFFNVYNVINNHHDLLDDFFPTFMEEYVLYDFIQDKKLKSVELFNTKIIHKNAKKIFNNNIGYAHFWGSVKYRPNIIGGIKYIINKEYPEYVDNITKFEYVINN